MSPDNRSTPHKTYLVCPLNWGLGHATRIIPTIYRLIEKGNKVILGGDGQALELLKKEFKDLEYIHIPDIKVVLKNGFNIPSFVKLSFQIAYTSIKEHRLLKRILKHYHIDVIISDNRYGLWNNKIDSIIVSHQLMVKLPNKLKWLEGITHWFINRAIHKFNDCWVPDYEGSGNLSGDLSHRYKPSDKIKFIGPQSRFEYTKEVAYDKNYDCLVILSGTEPQRTILQNKLISILSQFQFQSLIIEGKLGSQFPLNKKTKNIDICASIQSSELKHLIKNTKLIICRSGYSSIMDLHYLNKKALLIPTTGQTEQEYLSNHLKNIHFISTERKLSSKITSLIEGYITLM